MQTAVRMTREEGAKAAPDSKTAPLVVKSASLSRTRNGNSSHRPVDTLLPAGPGAVLRWLYAAPKPCSLGLPAAPL